MDEATAAIVLSLQLDDLNRLLDSSTTDNSKATSPDYRLVLTAYRDELSGRSSTLHDRRMGRSIANAVVADRQTLATVSKLENDAIDDRAAACRFDEQLNGPLGERTRNIANANRPAPFIDLTIPNDCRIDSLARLNSTQPDVVNLVTWTKPQRKSNPTPVRESQGLTNKTNASKSQLQPEQGNINRSGQGQQGTEFSSELKIVNGDNSTDERIMEVSELEYARLSSIPQKRMGDKLESDRPAKRANHRGAFTGIEDPVLGVKKICACCNDAVHYFAAVYAPCGHDYCSECAKRLFTLSTSDESLFPPRCCRQPIPLAAVDVFLTAEFIRHFHEKSIEYTTANKTYCAWPTCSAFIPPSKINGSIAVCPKCAFWVCTMCKGATHQGRDCPKDTALSDLQALAKGEGWQRCYRCRRYIELKHGCNHITCLCRAEFCYVCGARWKTCKCPQWDENRLVERANRVVNQRQAPEAAQAPAARAAAVAQVQNDLAQQLEDCDHTWSRERHDGDCEECGQYFPHFLYQCDDCGIWSCAYCRHHRL